TQTIQRKSPSTSHSLPFHPPVFAPEQGMAGTPFRATYIWTSIISNLQSQVEVKHRRHNLKSYPDCFLGSEAVDVVLTYITLNGFFGDAAVPRHKAVSLCQCLMDSKVFEPVGVKGFGKEKKKPKFEDSSCSLYRFFNPETTTSTGATDINSQSTDINERARGSPNGNQKRCDYSPSCLCEVWHQQAVSRLLQLIELPLLEDLLDGEVASRPPLHGSSSNPELLYSPNYLDREVLKAFGEAQADEWMTGALDCLEFLPDDLVVEVSRGLSSCTHDLLQCKKLLYQVLVEHYGQIQKPPLLNNCFFDIYSGISELLVNGKMERALEALQLSVKLQDSRSREELRRLLRFMVTAAKPQEMKVHKEIENRIAVKRAFSSAIIYNRRLPKGKAGLMVLFMMDNYSDLFKIPLSLHKTVSERIRNIVNGTNPDVVTGITYNLRVGALAYSESSQKTTKEEIISLIQMVQESPKFSAKDKKQLLGQISKTHTEIFVKYFGNKLSNVNMLLL
uniref:DEP domain-containing protein 7 n=1 Tax=Nothobranchius furzeri TaxID=105023 RepID=A0A8C6LGX2_NOTFU